ncbi:RNA polymerase RpoE-like sigma-24 subunit [Anaerobacterium chartisolvens]|uniref:RNA polymerase RpoE-like sigma-24 subunit n=1 Tax=Anaerobacterium chartisolvens TaxID=1297424 RepID=A0A369ASV7_9FIRM|nr:sigma-70 family RNA polymerase sigma factor [Anaerobacterium chartisolvens]RCX12321.1 RNA polymerase RpoE-like sigma-24 subunit [Anaerobacterium chartisolvens]
MYLLGTDEYIKRVVKQYSQLLLRIAFLRLRSTADAEDAVQEVFLRLMTKRPRFRNDDHEKAWLIRTVINLSCDMLKSSARKNVPLDEGLTLPQDEYCQLLSAVQSLPEKYVTVVHLYYYEDYSIKEIAKILELPAATVGTRLSRARVLLKPILEREELLYE